MPHNEHGCRVETVSYESSRRIEKWLARSGDQRRGPHRRIEAPAADRRDRDDDDA